MAVASETPAARRNDADGESPRSTTTSSSHHHDHLPTPDSDRTLSLLRTVTGDIAPKSVVASGRGQVFAQNMMYKHTLTVYDEHGDLVKTIPDSVDLAAFGIDGHPGISQGAPVEVGVQPGRHEGVCLELFDVRRGLRTGRQRRMPRRRRYRLELRLSRRHATLRDRCGDPGGRGAEVRGRFSRRQVPRREQLVQLLVPASSTSRPTPKSASIPLGPYPRGIVITPDSRTAYVAVMGTTNIARIDLATLGVSWIYNVGSGPRHLVLSPDGATLYATLNGEGRSPRSTPVNGVVQTKVTTGQAPRSMAISTDGKHLYVVNYESGTMSTLDASTMAKVADVNTGSTPSASPTTARPATYGSPTTPAAS